MCEFAEELEVSYCAQKMQPGRISGFAVNDDVISHSAVLGDYFVISERKQARDPKAPNPLNPSCCVLEFTFVARLDS